MFSRNDFLAVFVLSFGLLLFIIVALTDVNLLVLSVKLNHILFDEILSLFLSEFHVLLHGLVVQGCLVSQMDASLGIEG